MAWSGGSFSRATGITGWQDDAAAAIGITASRHDTQENELATGINQCINKDGSNAYTAAAAFGGFRATNVGAATAVTDATTAAQVQNGSIIWGGTSGGSANAQTITLAPVPAAYVAGQTFSFIAGFTNTSSPTLNVNALGAKNIQHILGFTPQGGEIIAGKIITVIYDGTSFRIISPSTPVIDRVTATVDIVSSSAETTLYTVSVPANLLGQYRILRLNLFGDIKNTTGSTTSVEWKVKLGGVIVGDINSLIALPAGIPTGVNRANWNMVHIVEGFSGNSQRHNTNLEATLITTDTPTGAFGANTQMWRGGYSAGAADSTIANTLLVTGTLSVNNANNSLRVIGGFLEAL